ncbi:MBOAT family protein [Chitinophaga sp. Cy-1792]|uniref:MBOAT family O-acyltransferase n=1 Tax=Chitinophaga sp. Cy-1792 TaxID=2608339 RepID=UPI0014205C35|nr:MBOAT family protein [Chitinophaga sp. Cy-1792]NIG54390.1 MBOAT family protein [Chitinophaga sp. Cy-1792]
MVFNSFEFALFLPIVFLLYWFAARGSLMVQNLILLAASFVFYGMWDYRFLFLLFFSILLDYTSGIMIHQAVGTRKKKIWLTASIGINLGFLFFFKYYNFFVASFADLLHAGGFQPHLWTLRIILPVGISFYTFHGLSYVIDVYYGKVTPTRNFVNYALFVSFFPLLVAGPIERATHLLPQIERTRVFDSSKAADGLRQILWGLLKKMVIADGCAFYANQIFNHSADYNGSTLLTGAVLFAFQIYGDFSGYSDMALGIARLFGFELLRNFAYPYFSRDIAEFWRRWHISLSSWFKDYVYIPLGGSREGRFKAVRNTFVIFLLSGFWHGANWTFIIWGAIHAVYFLPLLLSDRNRKNMEIVAQGRILPSLKEGLQMLSTFLLVTLAWVFFRAENAGHAFAYLREIFSLSLLQKPVIFPMTMLLLVALFMLVEWQGRAYPYALANISIRMGRPVRWAVYLVLLFVIILLKSEQQQFIYFQF